VKKTSHDAVKIHEVKKTRVEAEKAVRQKKYTFAAEKSCSLLSWTACNCQPEPKLIHLASHGVAAHTAGWFSVRERG